MTETFQPDRYQQVMLRTWHGGDVAPREQQIHAALGLAGETGELIDILKKHFYKPGYVAAQSQILDELADVFYYVAVIAALWRFTIDDMAAHLEQKLADGHGWNGSGQKIHEATR
jgi:NTP pyrophosphatase (non-canonical NTP hydrolase)